MTNYNNKDISLIILTNDKGYKYSSRYSKKYFKHSRSSFNYSNARSRSIQISQVMQYNKKYRT